MALEPGQVIPHDPDSILDYWIDWDDPTTILESGETIVTSVWDVVSGTASLGNTYNDGAPSTSKAGIILGNSAGVWVLTAGTGLVQLRNRITTSLDRKYDQTRALQVGNL